MKDSNRKVSGARKHRRRVRIRRLILVLLIFLIVVGFFFGGLYYAVSKFLKVNNIVVCGSSMYTEQDIIETSTLKDDGSNNMIFLSFKRIKENLKTGLPYIKDVEIYRSYPDTIIIEVEPDQPFAQIGVDDNKYLVDESLKILSKVNATEYDYLEVNAKLADGQKIGGSLQFEEEKSHQIFDNVIEQCQKNGLLESMNTIMLNDLFDIYMIYDDRIQIALGDYTEINSKIQFAANIISLRPETDKGIADVRSTQQAYFRLTRS